MYENRNSHPAAIRFPEKFQGTFTRSRRNFEPLLRDARSTLRELPMPPVVRPYFSYGVLEHAQPSFVLAPLMFLAVAESQGGITARHKEYLPAFLMMVELIGILDDTVDHTPLRSERTTYWRRFGAASATPFSCFLLSEAIASTAKVAPELLPGVTRMFSEVCAAETWEHGARYPEPTAEALASWLQHHYDAVPAAISHSLDSALILHGMPPLDYEVCLRFAELQQDVDDIVNFVERREDDGENDDLKMGIVTHPLLATLRAEPRSAQLLAQVWEPYRVRMKHGVPHSEEEMAECHELTAGEYAQLATLIHEVGVPATIEKIAQDAEAAIAAAYEPTRRCVSDLVWTFVERLCRIEELREEVERRCPAVAGVRIERPVAEQAARGTA